MLSKLSLSTQLDIYSPSPVNLLKLPSPNVATKTHTV